MDKVDIDPETLELVRDLYAAELTFADRWIGKLLNKLDDLGLADNTVVYYSRDHGVTLGEHGIIGKSTPRPVPRDPPRALHDPAPRGQARGADERLLRLHARRRAHDPVVLRRARARR